MLNTLRVIARWFRFSPAFWRGQVEPPPAPLPPDPIYAQATTSPIAPGVTVKPVYWYDGPPTLDVEKVLAKCFTREAIDLLGRCINSFPMQGRKMFTGALAASARPFGFNELRPVSSTDLPRLVAELYGDRVAARFTAE